MVRLRAMKFTLSVRFFHTPATPSSACPPSFPRAHLAGHAGHFRAEGFQLSTITLMVVLSSRIRPSRRRLFLEEVAVATRRDQGDVAHLAGQVVGHESSRCRSSLPTPADARTASPARHSRPSVSHLAGRRASPPRRKLRSWSTHGVMGVLERQDSRRAPRPRSSATGPRSPPRW